MSTQKESILTVVCRYLREMKIQSFLVGGSVRDMLLGREASDIDIAVAADALSTASVLAAYMGGKYVLLDESNHIGRVVLRTEDGKEWTFDFSTLRGTIEQDIAERDFTINAVAVDLSIVSSESLCFNGLARDLIDLPVIDPLKGQADIYAGIVRAVSPDIFKRDPVRLVRAVRLASELNLSIAEGTELLIKRDASLAASVAGERVREELLKLLAVPGSGHFLRYLDELGLLTALIPELLPSRDTTQPKEHQWKVLDHSLNTAIAVDFLARQGDWLYDGDWILNAVPWSDEIAEHLNAEVSSGSSRISLLKLAALLHDIAKPQTKALTASGKVRFIGHDREGAEIASLILGRLRFSSKEIKLVELYIRYHLRPTQLTQEALPSRRALYRYFRDTGDTAIDILFFSLADHLATRGSTLEPQVWREHAKLVEYVISQYYKTEDLVKPPKLVDGHDLINIFGMKPGPEFGKILEQAKEAIASGEISSREEALNYIREILKDRTGK